MPMGKAKQRVIGMDNFSKIALTAEKESLKKRISSLRKNMAALKVKGTDYYEHHHHLINTYNELVSVINTAIDDSYDVGRGI